MVEIIVPLGLFFSLAYATVGVTRAITDSRVRRRLLDSNASVELANAVVAVPRREPMLGENLKWGMLIGTVGLALIVLQFLPYDADDPIATGIILAAAAIALLGYHGMSRRMLREQIALEQRNQAPVLVADVSERV
jgi:hypothetical protein